jgi:A118 family predicted phage portal protein
MGKIACAEMAGLVLAEEPEVLAGSLVAKVIEEELLWDNLRRSVEYQGALGAQVLKVCIGKDEDGSPEVGLDFVKATSFIPLSWDNAEITEGSFIDRRMIKGKPYVRIETHRRARDLVGKLSSGYEITNKVFEEESQREAPLSVFGDGVEEKTTVNIDIPLFAYIRNPEANNIDPESPTGISLFANAVDTIKAIDISFDQFFSDIELGGRRIALPGGVFRKYTEVDPLAGTSRMVSYFDPADRVFMRLEGDDAENFKPQDLTFDIRAEQFKAVIQTLLDLFAFQIGFDAGYFAFDGMSVKTATEVISDNSHTYKTMQGFRTNLDRGLKHVFRVINALGVEYRIDGAETKEPTITWNDSVIEDRNSRTKYFIDLYTSKLVDLETAVKKIHNLSDADATKMAAKIVEDSQKVTSASLFPVGA